MVDETHTYKHTYTRADPGNKINSPKSSLHEAFVQRRPNKRRPRLNTCPARGLPLTREFVAEKKTDSKRENPFKIGKRENFNTRVSAQRGDKQKRSS